MAGTGSKARSSVRKRIGLAVIVAAAAIGTLLFWKRFDIGAWYLNRNQTAREMVILHMIKTARPEIERDVKMSLPQRIWSALAGRRNEKERRSDALKDVRAFGELCFENHWITFEKAPRSGSLDGINPGRFHFALAWNREHAGEVLAAFNVNLLKKEIDEMTINSNCGFFIDLKLYVEKKARAD